MTEREDLTGGSRETGDPLGFRSAAARFAPALVPIFTRSCCAVRQLSLTCLLLDMAHGTGGHPPERVEERFLRGERLWLLAMVRDDEDFGRWFAGGQWAKRAYGDGSGSIDLTTPALATQAASGLWGRSRRPAAQLRLISGRGGRPGSWKLTASGNKLAAAVRHEIAGSSQGSGSGHGPALHPGNYVARDAVAAWELDRVVRAGWALVDPPLSGDEVAVVSGALRDWDARHHGEFAALYRSWRAEDRPLTLAVDPVELTAAQALALRRLKATEALRGAIEPKYRAWLKGKESILAEGVSRRRAWNVLRAAGEADLLTVQKQLSMGEDLESVQRAHEELARRRGSRPWTREAVARGELHIRRGDPVEHRLDSIATLFEEGVDPCEERA